MPWSWFLGFASLPKLAPAAFLDEPLDSVIALAVVGVRGRERDRYAGRHPAPDREDHEKNQQLQQLCLRALSRRLGLRKP